MKIATFNINNVNARLGNLLDWLRTAKPDAVCLQELKAVDTAFPASALREAGYGAVWHGERSWNGVAILARDAEPVLTRTGLPGDPSDRQSRYIEAAVAGVLIGCLYAPNGNPRPGPKFDYKLAWLDRLARHADHLLQAGIPVVLAGDYNVVPDEIDIYPTKSWAKDALVQPASRAAFHRIIAQGWSTRSEPCIRVSGPTPSGTTSATGGNATPAFAWTTCWRAPTWPTGSGPPGSTARCAASPAPAITPRPGSC